MSLGSYSRSVQLPGDIKASFENGMLTIDVPKSAAVQPVKIPIGSGTSKKQMVEAGNNQK